MPDNNDTLTPLLSMDECTPYKPKAALVVFQNENSASYLELRQIRRDGSMGAAKPVSNEFIQTLLASFSKEYRSIPHGEIPPNLLYCDTRRGHDTFVWYNPPMKRQRFFSEGLDMEDGEYHVPGTLYVVSNNSISVFCFAGKKPAMDKTLLGVPYFNIYSNGNVCMGNAHADIPNKENLSYQDILNAWENAFWNSIDVHTNGSPSTKANLIETIKKFRNKPFDTKELETRKDGLTPNKIIAKLKNSK